MHSRYYKKLKLLFPDLRSLLFINGEMKDRDAEMNIEKL